MMCTCMEVPWYSRVFMACSGVEKLLLTRVCPPLVFTSQFRSQLGYESRWRVRRHRAGTPGYGEDHEEEAIGAHSERTIETLQRVLTGLRTQGTASRPRSGLEVMREGKYAVNFTLLARNRGLDVVC